jgi:hypothetical protein
MFKTLGWISFVLVWYTLLYPILWAAVDQWKRGPEAAVGLLDYVALLRSASFWLSPWYWGPLFLLIVAAYIWRSTLS